MRKDLNTAEELMHGAPGRLFPPRNMNSSTSTSGSRKRRIGLVGYGSLGQYLLSKLLDDPRAAHSFELAFVWNRSLDKVAADSRIPPSARCADLADFARFGPDLIVEVCAPAVIKEWGARFLAVADVMIGSPTALADAHLNELLHETARTTHHTLWVPAGALWGATDLHRLSARGGLASLSITMAKHPASLKLEGSLKPIVEKLILDNVEGDTVLYEGSVRGLCALAPNNVNTMAAAAIAASNLGFDGVSAKLIANPALITHEITIHAKGFPAHDGSCLSVITARSNPSPVGAVTGAATFASFLSSMLAVATVSPGGSGGEHNGISMC